MAFALVTVSYETRTYVFKSIKSFCSLAQNQFWLLGAIPRPPCQPFLRTVCHVSCRGSCPHLNQAGELTAPWWATNELSFGSWLFTMCTLLGLPPGSTMETLASQVKAGPYSQHLHQTGNEIPDLLSTTCPHPTVVGTPRITPAVLSVGSEGTADLKSIRRSPGDSWA